MENGFHPLVSIVIPVYNGSNYLKEAIDSSLAQTYSNIEIVVVNDGSTDGGKTEEIALSYGDKIRYFKKENGGVATALNLGIEKMNGEYFSWLSHDDMYTPRKVQNQILLLSELDDKTTLVSGGYRVVNFEGKVLYDVDQSEIYEVKKLETSVYSLFRGAIHGCSLLIHKSHFQRVGVFNTSLPTTQDYDLFFRILRGSKLKYQRGTDVLSRSHEEQDSKRFIDTHVDECNQLWIGMMEQLTDEEKIQIEGSLSSFYKNTYEFLEKMTLYDKAIAYAFRKFLYEEKKHSTLNKKILKEFNFSGNYLIEYYMKNSIKIKNKKRIAFLLGQINEMGGLNRVVILIANMLCDYYDVYLINMFGSPYNGEGYECSPQLNIITYPFNEKQSNNKYLFSKYLTLLEIDLAVISYNCSKDYLELFYQLNLYEIKTIAWNHEFYFLPYIKEELYNCIPIRNESLRYADVCVWLTSFNAQLYSLFHQYVAIMPNAITIEIKDTTKLNNINSREKNLIAIGRFNDEQKGLSELIYTFANVLKKSPNTKLYVLGPYDLTLPLPKNRSMTYGDLLKKLNISEDNIIFLGLTKEVEKYLDLSCIHIMPSHHEGFGVVILEAANHGVPSIVFDGSGLEDIITDGQDGYIVPYGNTSAMANKVSELLKDDSLLQQMSKNVEKLASKYEVSKIRDRWKMLIESTLTLNKDELGKYLKNNFMYQVKNEEKFLNQVVSEYEKFIYTLLNERNTRNQNKIIEVKSNFFANTEVNSNFSAGTEEIDFNTKIKQLKAQINQLNLVYKIPNKSKVYKIFYYLINDRQMFKGAIRWRISDKPLLYKIAKKIYRLLKR